MDCVSQIDDPKCRGVLVVDDDPGPRLKLLRCSGTMINMEADIQAGSIRMTTIRSLIIYTGIFFWACSSSADVHYVNISNSTPLYPFTNWISASTNIQTAIDAAVSNDVILVTNGTYSVSTDIVITNNVTLQSVNGRLSAILDGAHSTRVLQIRLPGGKVVGFTIRNGRTYGNAVEGGGAFIEGGVLEDCIISNSVLIAQGTSSGTGGNAYGGGVALRENGVIRNCSIINNSVTATGYYGSTVPGGSGLAYGGGVDVITGGQVENCVIISNSATGNGGNNVTPSWWAGTGLGAGGGCSIRNTGSIRNSLITNNVACGVGGWTTSHYNGSGGDGMGGGLYVIASGILSNCAILGNSAKGIGGDSTGGGGGGDGEARGGGVYTASPYYSALSPISFNSAIGVAGSGSAYTGDTWTYGGGVYSSATGTLGSARIEANKATWGGGVYATLSTIVAKCVVTNNVATTLGGGLYLLGGGVVDKCVVVDNQGNGIHFNTSGPLGILRNCEVIKNHGYGVYCVSTLISNSTICYNGAPGLYGTFIVENSILYFNTGDQYDYTGMDIPKFNYCCTFPKPFGIGIGNITNNPQFNNSTCNDFTLETNSPCIDSGNMTSAPDSDLSDIPRPLDGNADGIALPDIGAHEYLNPNADSDKDGIPDIWEQQYFKNALIANGSIDSDVDGMNNLQEYIAGTDPTNSVSVLEVTGVQLLPQGVKVDWVGGQSSWQYLESRQDLINTNESWLPVFTNSPPTTSTTNVTINFGSTNSVNFYRIRVER